MANPRVLLFGGNATISRLMASMMLERSWDVTSVIRTARQKDGILQLGNGKNGKIDAVVCDLERVRSVDDARSIIDRVKPNTVVFAAGSMSNPFAVDRDAARCVMKAAAEDDAVTKFLFISFPASRSKKAPWWSESEHRDWLGEKSSYPDIWRAKLEADQYLVSVANARNSRGGPPFQAISLRPTWLTNGRGTGRVRLGQAGSQGQVSRDDVARVAVSLLSRDDTSGWFDLFEGKAKIEDEVERVVKGNINAIEGEDIESMYRLAT